MTLRRILFYEASQSTYQERSYLYPRDATSSLPPSNAQSHPPDAQSPPPDANRKEVTSGPDANSRFPVSTPSKFDSPPKDTFLSPTSSVLSPTATSSIVQRDFLPPAASPSSVSLAHISISSSSSSSSPSDHHQDNHRNHPAKEEEEERRQQSPPLSNQSQSL